MSTSNSHKGESWPYHENRNTHEMVPCASNPCTIHGGSDVIATSPEDAYAKKYADKMPSSGFGFNRIRKALKTRKSNHASVSKQKFGRLRKAAVSFMMISIITSGLSACGSNVSNNTDDNSGDSSYSQQYSNDDVNDDIQSGIDKAKDKANSLYNKAKDAYNSDTGKEYRSKAKSAAGDALDALKGYVDSYDDGSSSDMSADVNGVPAYLNANPNIGMADLESLKVVPDHANRNSYDRKDYSNGTWDNINGSSCWSVRDEVIKRQADPGTLELTPDGCAVAAVTMTDPYTGRKLSVKGKENVQKEIQVDHVDPIANIDSNGASSWDSALKNEYYNDLTPGHLIATSAHENTTKSDKGPSEYLLSASAPDSYKKAYIQDMIAVIKNYNAKGGNLTIEQSDYNAMLREFQRLGVK